MSKISNLLISKKIITFSLFTALLVSSCVQQPIEPTSATVINSEAQPQPKIQVDKESNSIKVTQTADGKHKGKRKIQFDWPIWEARMTRGFLPKIARKRKRPHKGIDLAAPRGTAVMASHDGTIIYTGKGFKGYGKMIMIESNDGWATLYGHLDKIIVHEGSKIKQGEVIGALGNTGRSSGPHLHFEIRKLDGPVDPLPLLPAGEALTNEVDNESPEE
ncbi:MAG: M23 family metallopeptidase [Pseudobdellovibrio sp.]